MISTKDKVLKLMTLFIGIETRLRVNIHDIEAIGMLDEVISQLELASKEDKGVCYILDGLYQLQTYVKNQN